MKISDIPDDVRQKAKEEMGSISPITDDLMVVSIMSVLFLDMGIISIFCCIMSWWDKSYWTCLPIGIIGTVIGLVLMRKPMWLVRIANRKVRKTRKDWF